MRARATYEGDDLRMFRTFLYLYDSVRVSTSRNLW